MKIRTRLTLFFSLIFGIILLVFSIGVYLFYTGQVRERFYDHIHLRAAMKVDLIDGELISPNVLHQIYKLSQEKYEPQVSIYNLNTGTLIYRDKKSVLSAEKIQYLMVETRNSGECKCWEGRYQAYSFLMEGVNANYLVIVTGYDEHGVDQLRFLGILFIVGYLIVMLLVIFMIRFFIRQTLDPVVRMTNKVRHITRENQLKIRLDEGNRIDEFSELAITFNRMLEQLEKAFEAQKQFVFNISHELRTPLSAIITELELTMKDEKSAEDYKQSVSLALNDARRLAKLSNNMLDLAKANYATNELAMYDLRLDELLMEVCCTIQKENPKYVTQLIFDKTDFDDDRNVSVHGNKYLLNVAFKNLIENGCKYSFDKTCKIHISYEVISVVVRIVDNGIDILPEDLPLLFEPFHRGRNSTFTPGNGIGLSLAHKILMIHDGTIFSQSGNGSTVFTVVLPNLMK